MDEENQQQFQSAPYEAGLIKAFDKLTSEVFIFLLAYLILIIGLAVFAERLAITLKTLLYILPILGVAAYSWLSQKQIRNKATKSGIDVSAGAVTGSAKVIGVDGVERGNKISDKVRVRAGLATDKAYIGGVVHTNNEPETTSGKYLMELFLKLDENYREELISNAQKLLKKQGSRG